MANELGSALFLTRKAPSRGTLISMFSAWLLERLAWYHLEKTTNHRQEKIIAGLQLFISHLLIPAEGVSY